MTATKKTGTRANSPKVKINPPVEHVEFPKPETLASPYPEGVQVFSYQPQNGDEPIQLAMNGFEPPDKVWLFDLAQQPVLAQTWAWLRKANVPREIQRQAQLLPDEEYFAMFDQWFEAMKANGGPKGTVTSGK